MTSATAMMPMSFPSLVKNSGVLPCSARLSALCFRLSGTFVREEMNVPDPPYSVCPFIVPFRPWPASASKSATGSAVRPRASPFSTMARASGCSDFCSSA